MKKKVLIFIPISIVFMVSTLLILEKTGVTNFYSASKQPNTLSEDVATPEQTIDYSPATPTDNEEINQKKSDGFEQSSPPPDSETKNAIVTITRANANSTGVDLNVLLSGLTDGECTATLTQGSTVINSTSKVARQDQYVYCNSFSIDRTKLTEGKWTVTVSVISSDGKTQGTGSTEMQI